MPTILRSATLYDGCSGRQTEMSILIEAGVITAVGKDTDVLPREPSIELRGKTVMPGMTVGHWHGEFVDIGPPLFSSGRAGTFIGTESPPQILAMQAAAALQNALMSGVLRVISASCSNNIDSQLKSAIERHMFEGASLVSSSRHVLGTGDQEDRGKWWQAPPMSDGIRRIGGNAFVDGASQFTKATRQEMLFGAEIIKTYVDGGHGLEWTPTYRSITETELSAIVDAAHERGARVRAHLTNKESILKCIRAGVDILDHCDYMDEECIEAMVRHGSYFVPSPIFGKLASSEGRGEQLDPSDPVDRAWLNLKAMLPKANAAGVKIVPGDDYGAQGMLHEPGVYARELEIYVNEFGIPSEDVIRWATANGAEMALVGTETGTIEAGKAADLLVVDGDPGDDIGILRDPERNLHLILKQGRVIKNRLCESPLAEN